MVFTAPENNDFNNGYSDGKRNMNKGEEIIGGILKEWIEKGGNNFELADFNWLINFTLNFISEKMNTIKYIFNKMNK